MNKQQEALKLALEALRDYRRSDDDRVSVAMGILQEALADSALDRMAENARNLGLDYAPIVERVENSVGMGHGAWDMVDPKELAKGFHEALAEQQSGIKQVIDLYDSPEQPAQQDYWQEEARRYAQNAEFWRGKYEATTAQQQEPVAWIEHGSDEVPSVVVWERGSSGHYTPLYTSSRPSKPWVGLSEEDRVAINQSCLTKMQAAASTEAILREKNNG